MNIDPALLAPVLTVLFGGVFAGILTYALNARRAERDMLRQKVEALFGNANKYVKSLGAHYLPYYSVVRGELSMK